MANIEAQPKVKHAVLGTLAGTDLALAAICALLFVHFDFGALFLVARYVAAATVAAGVTYALLAAPSRRYSGKEAYERQFRSVRRRVLDRDGHHCQHAGCRATTKLHVHHRLARARGGSNSMGNLVTLCAYHHRLQHRRYS